MGSHRASGGINTEARSSGMGVWRGVNNPTCKKKIVEKPPRSSAVFCGGGQSLSWAVEPRKEERNKLIFHLNNSSGFKAFILDFFFTFEYKLVPGQR
jgi:hypothetical protein